MSLTSAIILTITTATWYVALMVFAPRFERADTINDLSHYLNDNREF